MTALQEEGRRARELAVMKRRATGLLLVMGAVFVVVTRLGGDGTSMGYLRAAVEASLVGGLADWFAVTALFRHPLGLPIPHTAVIAGRKDQFGETLGTFVQQNFLSSTVLVERLRAADVVGRAATWLQDRHHAERLAAHLAEAVVGLTDVLRDEDVHRLIEEQLDRALSHVSVAPLAGRALRLMTEDGRHAEVFEGLVHALEAFLEDNRDALRARFLENSPWWLPEAVDDRIFERLYDGVLSVLRDAGGDDQHGVRAQFDAWLESLAERLETSPDLRDRGEQLKHELLHHPEVRAWTSTLWDEIKSSLRAQSADADGELRHRLAVALVAAGERLERDPDLRRKAEELVEAAVCGLAERFHDEIAGLVSGTIERWDAQETSRKLELLLGRDLQFIRINGTVVGGLAGLAIHGVGQLLG